MADFNPSTGFKARTMEEIRAYERVMKNRRDRINAFLYSNPVLLFLSAIGIMFGFFNLISMASTLIFPAPCL
jgi:hypothetical protein